MADFMQAIQWMKEGKKVRRKVWTKRFFIYVEGYDIYNEEGKLTKRFQYFGHFKATDWEVLED